MTGNTTIGMLGSLLRLHRWGFSAMVAVGSLQSLAEGVGIGLIIPLLTSLVAGPATDTRGRWLLNTMDGLFQHVPPERRLPAIVLSVFVAVLATAALHYCHSVLFAWIEGNIGHDLRRRIYAQLLSVQLGFIERDRSGRLLNILATETWHVTEAVRMVVFMGVTATTIAVYVVLLLLMSWRLTLVVALGMLVVSGVVRLITRAGRENGERMKIANAELTDRMIEGLDGMRVIRAFGQERVEQSHFDAASDRLRRVMRRMSVLDAVVHPVHDVLAASLLLLTLLFAAPSAREVSVLLVFAFVLYRVQPRVKQFDAARLRLTSLSSSIEEVFSLLDVHDKQYVTSGTVTDLGAPRDIAFEHVSFHYDPLDDPALRDVSFVITEGRTTAFVGPSGGGKSTVMRLLLRFSDPTSGTIAVGAHRLSELDLEAWRSQIAFVSQDVSLFNATVRENIAYGRPQATEAEVVEAAKKADAHDFISRLPQQYDTLVGQHGVRLSGGQQQRISLARAIIRDPRILILDEATNALDSISEQWIDETLDRLRPGRTVIVIAHRLSTIERADHIIVLGEGRVQEAGTLADLVDAGGLFARLHSLQNRTSVRPRE